MSVTAPTGFVAAGIPCGVLMAPILPGITDHVDLLRRTAAAAIATNANRRN